MRIVFAGTPEFASYHLEALLAEKSTKSNHQIVAVYTQPDRPSGRGRKLTESPVKQVANRYNIEVIQPENFKSSPESVEKLAALKPDLMVVVAYGLILPKSILAIPKKGCINIHASLLPRWRGASPIQRAIEAGDDHTGISIMQMDEGMDTGDVLLKKECVIKPEDTAKTLHDGLMKLGVEALKEALSQIEDNNTKPKAQNDADALYAKKLAKEEARIDWSESASTIFRKIKAFNPWPVAWTMLNENRIRLLDATPVDDVNPLKTLEHINTEHGVIIAHEIDGKIAIYVQCGKGVLQLDVIQLSGKNPASSKEVLNSRKELFALGERFL